MGGVQPFPADDLAGLRAAVGLLEDRSRYSAVNWRRFGLATTSGSGAGLAPLARALGVSSLLNPQSPSAHLVQAILSL